MGTTDARGVLFKEYVRILDEIKPKGFLFENVYGIVGAQKGEPWKEIIRSFSEIGYKLYYRILDSADYGVPQHRERLIIVGLKEGSYKFPRPLFGPDSLDDSEFYTAGQAVEGADHSDEPPLVSGRYSELLPEIPPGLNYSFFTEELGNPNPVFSWRSKFSDFLYKADPDAPVRTIKAQGGQWTGPLHWDNRHFSISEYKRLQTFPDSYKIEGSKAVVIKQIGNSVPPQFARILAMSIADQIFGMDLPLEISYLEDGETLNFRSRKALLTKKYREVAAQALSGNNAPNWIETDVPEYMEKLFLNIGENFGLTSDNKIGKSVLIRWGKEFTVVITDTLEDNPEVITSFNISPKNGWNLGIEEINARICTEDVSGYVMAWKVIEGEINRRGLKADLVQLNGYYQYPSKIRCELKTTDTRLSFLEHIVDGSLTQRFISSEELSKEWDVPIEEVMERAEFMRTLGYEIRNHNTNPQIEEGFWLIPYPFPTLTPRSIQLHKKLR